MIASGDQLVDFESKLIHTEGLPAIDPTKYLSTNGNQSINIYIDILQEIRSLTLKAEMSVLQELTGQDLNPYNLHQLD